MKLTNTRIVMRQTPVGHVKETDFEIQSVAVPDLGEGQVLIKNKFLSLDPYMRLRMDPGRSYAPPLSPGDLMPGHTVGTVIESRAAQIKAGDVVVVRSGWQAYCVAAAAQARVIDPAAGPESAALSVLGMPGVTAHYGLMHIGRPKTGDTVLVSAASGAVGSVVGQIARLKGCRAVGIAGGPEKCRYVVETLGFDACIDYTAPDMLARLEAATPDRVDVIFENVGGAVMDAALGRMNHYARIALCGVISDYEKGKAGSEIRNTKELLQNRASLQSFIISEHMEYWPGALADLSDWVKSGKIKYREDIVDGLENAPRAFMRLLEKGNFGKLIVRLAA